MDLEKALFICHGNKVRSPAAMFLWNSSGKVSISAGMKTTNTPIMKKMRKILIADGFNKDEVESYRSKQIGETIMDWASVVFCMSPKQVDKLISIFPECKPKIVLLPRFIGKKVISDPAFSKGSSEFKSTYNDLKAAVEAVLTNSPMPNYPIVIVSKGRAGHAPFIERLQNAGIPYDLVLEKEDVKPYCLAYEGMRHIEVLKKSNMGCGYCRHFALKHMRKTYGGWFWKFDDDIEKFSAYDYKNRRFVPITFAQFIQKGEAIIRHYQNKVQSLGIVGFRQSSFGITKEPIIPNTRVITIVAVNSDRVRINYDRKLVAMSDEDFLIRAFKQGISTIKINHYMYTTPYSGSIGQIGGFDWQKIKKSKYVKMVEKKHPDVVKFISKDGGTKGNPQYSIAWQKIKPEVNFEVEDVKLPIVKNKEGIKRFLR